MTITMFKHATFDAGSWARTTDYALDSRKVELTLVSPQILSSETAAIEMEAVAAKNVRVRKPLVHMAISWSAADNPPRSQIILCLTATLKRLDLTDQQWVAAVHGDAAHVHLHLVVNRVHPVRHDVARMSFSVLKCNDLARELERQYDLVPGRSWRVKGESSVITTRGNTREPLGPVNFYNARSEAQWTKSLPQSRVAIVGAQIKAIIESPACSSLDLERVLKRAKVRLVIEDTEVFVVDLSRPERRASLREYQVVASQIRDLYPGRSPNSLLSSSMFADMRARFVQEMTEVRNSKYQTDIAQFARKEETSEVLPDRNAAISSAFIEADSTCRPAHVALLYLASQDRKKALAVSTRKVNKESTRLASKPMDIVDWQKWLGRRAMAGDEDAAIIYAEIQQREALIPVSAGRGAPIVFVLGDGSVIPAPNGPRLHPDRTNGDYGANKSSKYIPSLSELASGNRPMSDEAKILFSIYQIQCRYGADNPRRKKRELDVIFRSHLSDLCALKGPSANVIVPSLGRQQAMGFGVKIASRLIVTGHDGDDIVKTLIRNGIADDTSDSEKGRQKKAFQILAAALRWLINHVEITQKSLSGIWKELEFRAVSRSNAIERVAQFPKVDGSEARQPLVTAESEPVNVPAVIRGVFKKPIVNSQPRFPGALNVLGSFEADSRNSQGITLLDGEQCVYAVSNRCYQIAIKNDRKLDHGYLPNRSGDQSTLAETHEGEKFTAVTVQDGSFKKKVRRRRDDNGQQLGR